MSEPIDWLAEAPPDARGRIAAALNDTERAEFDCHWEFFARDEQLPPEGMWRVWLILAGRGFGKTRAGAEWVRSVAESNGQAKIALLSSSLGEARSVMVEGESGIIACCPPERRPVFEPSLKRLRWPNGASAQLFSAAEPESLRGPQHSHARRSGAKRVLCESGFGPGRCVPAAMRGRFFGSPAGRSERRQSL